MSDEAQLKPEPLVYGEIDQGLVFIAARRAEDLIETGEWEHVWPAREMVKILPADLVSQYGVLQSTLMDGDFVSIPLHHEDALVRELETRGWDCERDDAMVMEASGYV